MIAVSKTLASWPGPWGSNLPYLRVERPPAFPPESMADFANMKLAQKVPTTVAPPARAKANGVCCPKCGQPICQCLLEDRKFLATKVGQMLRKQRRKTRAEPLIARPRGPIRLDNITIHCGDCLDIMPTLPDQAVVVTSIPYNIGIDYGKTCDDARPLAEYLAWLRVRFEAIKEKLRDDGSFFLNLEGDGWTPFHVAGVLQPLFCLQNRIEWIKSLVIPERDCPHCARPIPSRQIGHFRSLGGDISLNRCGEILLHLTKHRSVRLDRQTIGVGQSDKTNAMRFNSSIHCAGNQWFIPYDTRIEEAEHPCPFPVELVKRCILLHGVRKPDLVVLDPFMGRGSAMRAVVEVNREYGLNIQGIGIEINPEYCRRAEAFIRGASPSGPDPCLANGQ